MPMPREEEDDLFHDVEDVDFDDDDASEEEKPKKKTAKRKTAKKKAAPKKKAKKKVAKKKRVTKSRDDDDEVKPVRRKRKKTPTKARDSAGFGAGLFEGEEGETADVADVSDDEGQPEEKKKPAKTKAKSASDPEKKSGYSRGRPNKSEAAEAKEAERGEDFTSDDEKADEKSDEYGRPEPVANYVVHVYELGRLKRTIDRDFTPELAEKYATEFSRTAKKYGRKAIAGKKDTQPVKELVDAEK